MSKPDALECYRQTLHHLAAIGAEVEENKLLLCDVLAHLKNLPVEQVRQHYAETTQARTAALYLMSLEAARVALPADDDDLPGEVPPTPPDRGANPRL